MSFSQPSHLNRIKCCIIYMDLWFYQNISWDKKASSNFNYTATKKDLSNRLICCYVQSQFLMEIYFWPCFRFYLIRLFELLLSNWWLVWSLICLFTISIKICWQWSRCWNEWCFHGLLTWIMAHVYWLALNH